MNIYTRTGDLGETALIGGPRVGKDMARIEVCGEVDELNCALGATRSETLPEEVDRVLHRLQNELFEVGAELATPNPVKHGTRTIGRQHVLALESEIDAFSATLPELKQFILPGGIRAAASLHTGRAICRRVERRLVALVRESEDEVSRVLLAYLNRLGDLLFVLARAVNAKGGGMDVPWEGSRKL
ncbi:MAG: cob(I)yrinic acid a,c-diamide adenosyltransferase [Pirellulales bacterium]|nr:cob(I)yrinic acid a,c-diamide adenosyltransferase [Pirellulales bacterium]